MSGNSITVGPYAVDLASTPRSEALVRLSDELARLSVEMDVLLGTDTRAARPSDAELLRRICRGRVNEKLVTTLIAAIQRQGFVRLTDDEWASLNRHRSVA